jgi:hypothetical protein
LGKGTRLQCSYWQVTPGRNRKLEAESGVWEIMPMNKPHLIVTEQIAGSPVKGGCSSCPDVIFTTSGRGYTSAKQMLEILFREHFRTMHEGEAASAVAAGSAEP